MRLISKSYKYWFFILIYLLVSAILPSLFLLVIDQSDSMWHQMVNPAVIYEGLFYTTLASLVLVIIAWFFNPNRIRDIGQNLSPSARVMSTCFYIGILGFFIRIGLNLMFGMNPSNLTAQKPDYAVFAGYLNAMFILCGTAFFYQEMRNNGLSGKAFLYINLYFVDLGSAWSRSAIIDLFFIVSLAFAYSNTNKKFRFKKTKNLVVLVILTPIAIISVYFAQLFRGEDTTLSSFPLEGLQRLFDNNVALFLAIDRFDKLHSILVDGQPWVVIDQLFSFFRERTLYPSSMRFVELSGFVVSDERGHISAYAYGWLGLTYGIAGFLGGLLLLSLIFLFHFWGLRLCFSKSNSLMAMLFFAVFASSLIEFSSNLGIDSYVEKFFKNSIYAILAYFLVSFMSAIIKNTDHTTRSGNG